MIKYACAHANDWSLGEYSYRNGLALETLKREHGIVPRAFSDAIMKRIWTEISDGGYIASRKVALDSLS